VSESRDDGQPESGGQPRNNEQPGNNRARSGNDRGQSRPNGQSGSGSQPGGGSRSGGGSQPRRGSDPIADFQRWLMRAGARSMANQVADQVRRTVGQDRRDHGDVWDTATNEAPPEEPPECQWCPICQAARAARTSGPGLGAQLANAGGVVASVLQDAFSAFEQVMKDQNRYPERPSVTPASSVTPPSVTPPSVTPPPAPPPKAAPDKGDGDQ
jgi:hypothetical protein